MLVAVEQTRAAEFAQAMGIKTALHDKFEVTAKGRRAPRSGGGSAQAAQRRSRIGHSYARACARSLLSGLTAQGRPTTASIG